ncbi:MAG: hypothetical protein R3335_08895 [Anaerolineales bacterium]|nr:hypothetical protein [Anaerolineales bacterium]
MKARANQLISTEVQAGEPVEAGHVTVIPMGKATRIRLPGFSGGLVWNRPSAVVAQYSDGQSVVIPVKDHTRIILIALLGGSLAMSAFMWLLSGKLIKG